MADRVLILEPGEDRALKIAKAMASQTASDILQLLGGGEKSLTAITEELNIPLTTAKYHVGNLLGAGIVEVADTRYSVKGREVKLYRVANKLFIVAPKSSPVRELLLKYASLFGIVTLATVAVAALAPLLGPVQPGPLAPELLTAGRNAASMKAAQAVYDTGSTTAAGASEYASAFFLGGCLVIFLMFCYDTRLWQKFRR
jgi:DNA-binding transcriptional ArsR family regulator